MNVTLESDLSKQATKAQAALVAAQTRQQAATAKAARALLQIMQNLSHVKTGRMRASEVVNGPFEVATGAYEVTIGPTVDYAEHEVARGGDHDFVTRTLEAGQAVLDALRAELESAIVEVFTQ